MTKAKNCPFCGGKAKVRTLSDDKSGIVFWPFDGEGKLFVECGRCSASTLNISDWNNRGIIDILVDALEFYSTTHKWPNDGPWGSGSDDFGKVATQALEKYNTTPLSKETK